MTSETEYYVLTMETVVVMLEQLDASKLTIDKEACCTHTMVLVIRGSPASGSVLPCV